MKIDKIEQSLQIQTVSLFRSIMLNSSPAKHFYTDLIMDGRAHKQSLLHRTFDITRSHNMNLWEAIYMSKRALRSTIYPRNEECGITDTIVTLINDFNGFNRNMLNLLLFPIQ